MPWPNSRSRPPRIVLLLVLLVAPVDASRQAALGQTSNGSGEPFDAVPFGELSAAADGKAREVRWANPRYIRRVVVEFPPGADSPDPSETRIEYWHQSWDGKPDPSLTHAAGRAGWTRMDDWTNGKWKDADTRLQIEPQRWTFTFAPTGEKEFEKLGRAGVRYRKTLKVRLVSAEPLPAAAVLRALTDAVCQPLSVRILWGDPACGDVAVGPNDPCHLEVFNGRVRAVRPVAESELAVDERGHWTLPPTGRGAMEADLVMIAAASGRSGDRTIVTVRSKFRPFSFEAAAVARGERILVDDLGILVVRADDPATIEQVRRQRQASAARTVYDRVLERPEQTLSHAWHDMPLKRPLWFVHGLPGNRNAMKQFPNGDIAVTSNRRWFAIDRSPKDSDRKGWAGNYLFLRFGFPAEDRRAGRELQDGYLPQLRTWWVDGPVYYEQTTILDKLDGDLSQSRLDDPTVLLLRVRVLNVSDTAAGTARLHLTSAADGDEAVTLEGDRLLARAADGPRLRLLVRSGGNGQWAQAGRGVGWSRELQPGESDELLFLIPSITLSSDREMAALRQRDFGPDAARVRRFWEELTARGTQIDTPEPWLNGFYKAHLRHLQVNCVKDIKTNWRYARVGTFAYGLYPNESIMMVSDLDRRGYHRAAEDCLDAWLEYQGSVPLPGNFKSADGLFYGSAGYEHVGYNKHHGYVMWGMAEHWRFTRDRRWMERVAPKLIKACDWVIRERQATMQRTTAGRRRIEYGFLPAGGLEDVQDYWYWTATNAATVWGLAALADALSDYGHPEAARLQREATAYRQDVLRGLTEARILTPVVRLRDGTYVPKFPSRLYQRGRALGWIRETLEGSLCLLVLGLVPPEAPEAAWILKDYEDNLYISDRYGYAIPNFDDFWFSRGGFSMQSNLLEGPVAYLYRDQIKHCLRAYFNGFAAAFYPGIRMCNEHCLPELGYPAGDHFKSSDEANVTCWLRLLFVREQGAELYLGQAIPRPWLAGGRSIGIERAATHFGPMSLRISARADEGAIEAILTPPERNRPERIYLRLRHPKARPIQRVTLNGQSYDEFDTDKEWIVLPGDLTGVQKVVARY